MKRQSDAADLLREQLKMFPGSEDSSAALYFLGRTAEQRQERGAAKVFYEEIAREYPNQYYAGVARERLEQVRIAQPVWAASDFLKTVSFPERSRVKVFDPNATAKARIERSRLLASAELRDWAEIELRFGAQTEDQPHLLAMELAALTSEGKPQQ